MLQQIDDTVDFILDLLNIRSLDDDFDEHIRKVKIIIDFMVDKFGMLTIEEIKEAFRMYVANQFDAKVFRMLDCVLVGEVLNSYIEYRSEALKTYTPVQNHPKLEIITSSRKKEINESSVNRVYLEYKNDGYMQENTEYIFDYLAEVGNIKLATESTVKLKAYYDVKSKEAAQIVLDEKKNEMKIAKSKQNVPMINILNTAIESIEAGTSKKVTLMAKRLVLRDYFNKCILDGKQIIF